MSGPQVLHTLPSGYIPFANGYVPYEASEADKIENKIAYEQSLLELLESRLSRATAPMKRHRYVQRIHKAQARLLALKLAQP